jgi:hypothetical protein
MLYKSGQDWRAAKQKRVLLFAMSGLGKTHVSSMLRTNGNWFHYSIDYRIGTRYMGDYIADNAKAEAMKNPFLRDLLLSDSIYIGSNLSFHNLDPMSAYLGKPGNSAQGGLPIGEFCRRQDQFRRSEISALMDTAYFIERSQRLYDYDNFICDTGGSICEWVDADNPDDPLLRELSKHTLMVWIKGHDDHAAELARRFDAAPKPMAYQPEFLARVWEQYLDENACTADQVVPDDFIRWAYSQALAHRQPRYDAMARNWGITVQADAVGACQNEAEFNDIIADALDAQC